MTHQKAKPVILLCAFQLSPKVLENIFFYPHRHKKEQKQQKDEMKTQARKTEQKGTNICFL